ncbi:hypothetical protein FOF52_05705 [Thermobifida alba]|uniref:Integral membrane protein n=1 Tax=Thermobifida alba TaxID=53522 RepID=A0ABY4KZM3_THEAE|nr:hypothetical protein [Thermobifida alba]UPT20529.1 hypothetical protein FOF52_05705 [Thermobifida alba]HLU98970.1 hypothetical protein [Thermobifida alba]
MRQWTPRQWTTAAAGTLALLLILGVPTVLLPNSLFTREIEPTWWSYPVWAATAVLGGLLLATYTGPHRPETCTPGRRRGLSGGVLAWLAIGCPVCNKLVLAALGASGALTYFAPLQPVLALAGLALLAVALWTRLHTPCAAPAPAHDGTGT